jgi:hypothetical protein
MKELNKCGGVPTNDNVGSDTIRMTVQVDVPYESKIMNYGDVSKQKILDFINSDAFTSYSISAGPSTKGIEVSE